MSRTLAVLAVLVSVLVPVPGHAVFHIANIDDVVSGTGGNANAQYVAIRMLLSSQGSVAHSRLTAFNCDGSSHTILLEVPGDVCPATAGGRWTMGTTEWATVTGDTPDFLFPASTAFSRTCGMICWGAPGTIAPPPNPPTWDAGDLTNYVDCVAYGSYTGPLQPGDAAPSTLAAGDNATMSLHRTQDTSSDAADFALAARTATHNGTCATTTTTTSTTTTVQSPKSKCTSKQFAAAGKKAAAKLKCYSKGIAKGTTADSACLAAADGKFTSAFGKATGSGDCLGTATATMVENTVDNYVQNVNTQLVDAPVASRCTSKEFGATGKLAGTETKCHSKAIAKGDQSSVSACIAAAKAKFEAAYGKAMVTNDCILPTDAAAIENSTDTFVGNLQSQLAP